MKKITVAANWKSNKTVTESIAWIRSFKSLAQNFPDYPDLGVIVCVPYIDLYPLKQIVQDEKIPLQLGAQDVSPFVSGAYTGQITAGMLQGLADWVIVGHSERRNYFHETDADLTQKTAKIHEAGLKSIFCISDENMSVPGEVDIVAYEPLWAIGTGKTDTPENADHVMGIIKSKTGGKPVLYGGSVKSENVAALVKMPSIDGVLVGGASLEAGSFFSLVQNSVKL